jgi:hypothetical protein
MGGRNHAGNRPALALQTCGDREEIVVKSKQKQDFESAVGKLNAAYFFREFTFSTNTFKPSPASELELADKVVWLDDLMILSQIKERMAPPNTTADKERKWFADEVVKKATRQMRDTLSYLKTYPKIKVRNGRRHVFNLASAQVTQTHRIVIYNPHPLLPSECATKKYHRSKTAGVLIHLIHALAYHAILRTLITPAEIAEYLAFREALADKWGEELSRVGEKALVGQYIRNLPDQEPSAAFEAYVDAVNQQAEDWDIARLIHLFPARRTTPIKRRRQGYTVLRELAKLYRTDMAEFKKRFAFSMDKALADEASLPNRLTASTGCGFVFIPLQRKQLPRRKKLLVTFTELNKYDQHLDKCIGLTFIAEGKGSWCDVQWLPVFFPWKENAALQEGLDTLKPFRPVKSHRIERYGLRDLP